jgi:DNA-binding MarR family transcriptional regulator
MDTRTTERHIARAHDIREHIVFRMALFATITDRAGRLSFNGFGLSLREYRILAVIGYMQPVTLTDLVAECYLDKGQVSRNIAKLVDGGLVARSKGKSEAERGGQLRLTPDGEHLLKQALARGDELNAEMAHNLTDEELAVLSSALDKLLVTARAKFDALHEDP